jgi:hypothetical protein
LEDALKKCSDVVEGLYREWFLKELTLNWTNAIAGDLESLGYVSEINRQRDFYLDGNPTASTPNRGAILGIANPNSVAVTNKELLQMKQSERRALVQGKDVVYIYHNTIDALGDKAATETKVFEACDTAIDELTAIVKIIVGGLSGVNAFITADHGFLYTYRPLEESQKISRQTFSGEIYESGRRYALVPPETAADYLLPVKTERELGGIAMKGYAPQDTVRIKVQGGGENYIHGGVSLKP